MKFKLPALAHNKFAVAGAAAAVGLGLYARNKAKAGGSSAGSTPGAVAGTTTASMRGGVYDSTANDVYNSIEPQLQNLSDQLGALGGTVSDQAGQISGILGMIPPAGAAGSPAQPGGALDGGTLTGSGWGPGNTTPVFDVAHAASYQWIQSESNFNMLPPGQHTYYQPTPGTFERADTPGLKPGTPQFFRIGEQRG